MEKKVIGTSCLITIGQRKDIPAKIDTGADSSSISASKIRIDEDGTLMFSLFSKGSPYYNGKTYKRKDYSVAMVKSAMGERQIRYRTHFVIEIQGKKIKALFHLSNRATNSFPVLIGKRTLRGKFFIDPSITEVKYLENNKKITRALCEELEANPYEFHQKHYKN